MTGPRDVWDELDRLLLEERAGTLDEPGRDRLRALLRESEVARARYVESQVLTLALELESGPAPAAATTVLETPRGVGDKGRRRRVHWSIPVAAALVVAVLGRWMFLESTRGTVPVPHDVDGLVHGTTAEATTTGVAVITRLVDVEWPADGSSFDVGDAVPPGRLAIASGFAQVEFFCGATVVLEGPAELDLESATEARFLAGRLRAKVPPAARGFEVHVGEMSVVDLGTEFGLEVSPNGADVQVFDGEVEVHRPGADPEHVLGGRAVRHERGTLTETDLLTERFVDIADLDQREREQDRAGYERWRAHSARIRTDPRLIAYYAFDTLEPWQRTLPSSAVPADDELDGAIVGAGHVPGRWNRKGALEFKRPGDRVKVHVPGEYGPLTLACWVRIDSLDRWYNSLFLTDHYEPGEPHWQILDDGRLFFSVRRLEPGTPGKPHQPVLSAPFWKPSLSGKWLHLATTYDSASGEVTHYLNGDVIGRERIDDSLRVETTRIGTASIGNWAAPTKPDAEFAIRNINGRIDEFALFGAALDETEIREMYDHGKP